MTHHDPPIAIIGAGPIGLFAVFAFGMLNMRCCVIDSLNTIGGQCSILYPDKPIYDIPALKSITGRALINRLQDQAEPFQPEYYLGQRISGLARQDNSWLLTTEDGRCIQAQTVVIAAGVGVFSPHRPPIANIESFEKDPDPGRGVKYHVSDLEALRGRRVAIAGGGDSAVDWALTIANIASETTIIHRRSKFRAAPASLTQLQAYLASGKIRSFTPFQLADLEADESGHLTTVIIQDFEGQKHRVESDLLLPFFGLMTNLGPILDWGLALDKHHIEVDPSRAATNLPGVFAIGDICSYPGKLKLILTGFAEAEIAAHAAYHLIFPDQALHFEYSTRKGIPGLK